MKAIDLAMATSAHTTVVVVRFTQMAEGQAFIFFKMPLKSPQKTLWCNRMGKREGVDGFSVTNNTKVCHLHFRPEDIVKVFSQFQNLHNCHLYLVNIIVVII